MITTAGERAPAARVAGRYRSSFSVRSGARNATSRSIVTPSGAAAYGGAAIASSGTVRRTAAVNVNATMDAKIRQKRINKSF
jgi:hypothetical protein